MNKEEILEKSRGENHDEGLEYAMSKGQKIGVSAMATMFLILTLFNFWHGISNHQVFSMFWAYLGFESFGRYRITKQKALLAGAVFAILAGILYAISYILSVLR